MVGRDVFLTPEGLNRLENELNDLKTINRKEIAERIKHALAFGDISENAEYDQAKNEQAQLEEKISKLEDMLRNAKIIHEDEITTDKVSVGSRVKVLDIEFDEETEYTIVGSAEANPYSGRISNESPVGRSLLGKKIDDIVDVQVPDGVIQFKIIDIMR